MQTRHILPLILGTLAGASAAAVSAQEETGERPVDLAPLTVIGSRDNVDLLPGSGEFLDIGQIRTQNYDNIDQVIRQVPGVYFRTEDGFGLFPNISFRGVGSMRTSKLTVMEDGILSAPAPYSAPAAYYTPTSGRMNGLEILKGSSQVRFGPQTTGGVLNYLSTPVPAEPQGYFRGLFGENNEWRAHAWLGETRQTDIGRIGILVEHYFRSTDGFKTIDQRGFRRPGDTGFSKSEPMLKVSWEPNSSVDQRFEFKFGYTDMTADETYLGLSEDDFNQNPFRRYSASQEDRIETEQFRTYLRHQIRPSDETQLTTTGYFNYFTRSWFKLQEVSTQTARGSERPGSRRSLAEALAENGNHLAVLRGDQAGTLRYRDNNREYRAMGIESQIEHQFETGEVDHHLTVGVRHHHDYEDRFQNETNFVQDGSGVFASGGVFTSPPGSQDNRRGEALALALFIEDRMTWDALTLAPGVRYERIRYTNTDRRRATPRVSKETLDIIAPGIGGTYEINDNLTLLSGVYRGFSVPGPSQAVDDLREETSIGFEIGGRYRHENSFRLELIYFLTDFQDLIVVDNQGAGGVTGNAGSARSQGIELGIRFDPGQAYDWAIRTPSYLSFTYTNAELTSNDNAEGGAGAAVEGIFAGGRKGNRLPYVPEFQVAAGTGVEWERYGLYLDAIFVDETFGTANNTSNLRQGVNADGPLDSRFGKNDAYFLLDVSFKAQITNQVQGFVGVQNLLDETYLASRIPQGPRPGAPRFAYAGVQVDF